MPISAFGSLSVNLAGHTVDLGPPRRRAVLAMLLVKVGHVVSVSALLEGIWGTEPPPQAVASLQSYISRLRKLLSGRLLLDGSRLALEYRSPGYVLVASANQIDVACFESHVDEGLAIARAGNHRTAFTRLGQALSMWTAAPFEELRDYQFAQQESSRLESVRFRAVEQRAESAFTLNLDTEVLPELEVEVARNPTRERLVGLLMRAQYRTGRQADALRTFDRTRHALADELGVDVSPELQRMHASILRHDRSLHEADHIPDQVGQQDLGSSIPSPREHRARYASKAMVGRRSELARLVEAWHTVNTGGGRVVLLSGEAGQGKTRLVQEFEAQCLSSDAQVVTVHCPQVPNMQAYWPWAQLFSRLRALYPEQAMVLPPALRRVLASIAPEFALPNDPVPDIARAFILHDTIARALPVFACRPLVVVLENFHWADSSSLETLRFLGSQLHGVRVLLVVTFRNFMITYRQELRLTFASVLQQPLSDNIQLLPLERAETDELVAGVVEPGTVSPTVEAALFERTGGNPYFALNLATKLSACTTSADVHELVPLSLAEVVLERLRSLPGSVIAVLTACCVLDAATPRPVVEELIAHTGGSVDAIQAAVRGHLLAVSPGDPELVEFVHPLLRDIMRQDLSVEVLADLHHRAIHAFAQYGEGFAGFTKTIATHTAAAMRRIPLAMVLAPLMDRVDQLSTTFRYGEALRHVALVSSIIAGREGESDSAEFQLRVLKRHVELLQVVEGGCGPVVMDVCDRIDSVSSLMGHEPCLASKLRAYLADINGGHLTLPSAEARLGTEQEPMRHPSLLVSHHFARGVSLHFQGKFTEAMTEFDRILDMAAEVPEMRLAGVRVPVVMQSWRAMTQRLDSGPDSTRNFTRDLVCAAVDDGDSDPVERVGLYFTASILAVLDDDPAEALAIGRIGARLAKSTGLALSHHLLMAPVSWARVRLGDHSPQVFEGARAALVASCRARIRLRWTLQVGLLADMEAIVGEQVRADKMLSLMRTHARKIGDAVYPDVITALSRTRSG